jgi:O-antigen ligase
MKTLVSRQYLQGQIGKIHWRGIRDPKFTPVLLIILAGLIQAIAILVLNIKSFPLVFFVLLILPWLIKKPFRLFIWLIITWPILTLFVRIPLPAGIPDFSYDRALILLLICIVIIEALLSKMSLMKITPLDILMIIYVIAQLIDRLYVLWFGGLGDSDLTGFLNVFLIPIALYWTAKNFTTTKRQLKWLLYALVIAALLVCLTGLYEQAIGTRIFKTSLELGGYEVVYQWEDPQGGLRAAGALGNPAIYGAFLGMGSLAGLSLLSLENRKTNRIALIATILLLLYGVLASFTRSAWISVAIVLFVAQFLINDIWKKTLPFITSCGIGLFFIWNFIPSSSKIIQRALNTKTITQRYDLFSIGLQRFVEKPVWGWGSGALNYFDLSIAGEVSHNIYLTLLVDGGLILFISFALLISYLLIRSIKIFQLTLKGSIERNILIVMVGGIIIYLMSGLALELRYFSYFNSLFWIFAGIVDCLGVRFCTEKKVNG